MKKILLLTLFFLIAFTVDISAQMVELNLNGISIGTTRKDVFKKLGKPLSSKINGEFPCNNGKKLVTKYSGLTFEMIADESETDFFVANVIVTSEKWTVSGIRIGASLEEVKDKFGNKKVRKEEGFDVLSYPNAEGYANFFFKKNKLVKISWELNVC